MRATRHLLTISVLLLACRTGAPAQECSQEQKNKLREFFRGRTVTAKIDLPLVQSPGGLWVFWNGQYDLDTYAESLKHGPASILRGQSSTIKEVRVRGKESLYDALLIGKFPDMFNIDPYLEPIADSDERQFMGMREIELDT